MPALAMARKRSTRRSSPPAVKIEDHRPPRRGWDAPRDQNLPILGLQTKGVGLESERRRVDLSGVTPEQDLALTDEESDEHGDVESGAGRNRDQHRSCSAAIRGAA